MSKPPRAYDVVVFGATGFTGRVIAARLATLALARQLRCAIAGRRADALAALAAELGGEVLPSPLPPALGRDRLLLRRCRYDWCHCRGL